LSFRLGMTQTTDRPPQNATDQAPTPRGFTEIGVTGFKSFAKETRIQLGSLTILAGANSSGKSSLMQPLLLMKQTIEASYNPSGAFLLNGPNVQFTSGDQMLARSTKLQYEKEFTIHLSLGPLGQNGTFSWNSQSGFELTQQSFSSATFQGNVVLTPDMGSDAILETMAYYLNSPKSLPSLKTRRDRCFLELQSDNGNEIYTFGNMFIKKHLQAVLHVQGLRGNPKRTYKTAAVSDFTFVGLFEDYVASIIDRFQKENPEQLIKIQEALQKLGLTDIVQTQRLNDTQIELRVGRVLGQADPTDTVNIADVGFGVSQVLPVIVALLVAQPGQLVYIEQPEIHLHPRAQIALSEIFADAANRGVRVVVETHSELFLLGVQSLVAEDKLDPKEVKLHWFTRNPDGSSKVTSAELDTTGAFGDWPEDFGMTALALENRYLSAAEAKLWNAGNGRSPN
jgi:predicted ATPase